jgi:vacuolar-type H+-ATPase subunit H
MYDPRVKEPEVGPSSTHGGREVAAVGDEQKLEDIKFFQDVLHKDKDQPDSPLYQIREKELEISGRVLKAKKQAEQIVADARKKAFETQAQAESEGEKEARIVEERMMREADEEAGKTLANVDKEVAEVRARTTERIARAAKVVAEAVKKV